MTKTYNLWARVGVSVSVSEDDKEEFLKDPYKFIEDGLKNGKCELDGETYFPQEVKDDDNYKLLKGEWS